MHIKTVRDGLKTGWGRVALLLALVGSLMACMTTKDDVTPPFAPSTMTEEARCAAGGDTWDATNLFLTNGYCAKGSPAQCKATDGNWQRVCMLGKLACVQAYPDADKTCRSGSDCQGKRCLQKTKSGGSSQPQTGRCIANNNPCYFGINLENGQPVPTAVAD
jgi:hypothetical protein